MKELFELEVRSAIRYAEMALEPGNAQHEQYHLTRLAQRRLAAAVTLLRMPEAPQGEHPGEILLKGERRP